MTKGTLNYILKILLILCFNNNIINNKKSLVQAGFKLNVGDPDQLCPGNGTTCSDGSPHYLCTTEKSASRNCRRYKHIAIDNKIRRTFVQGHNGIRNKLADDYDIANMNLVYWSPELSTMATEFVHTCHVGKDPCSVIGENKLIVNQNWIIRPRLIGGWPARVVRHWYVEVGYGMQYENIAELREKGRLGNFSQMLWPLLEFIGCSAAKIDDFYLVVCFYYPPYDTKEYDKGVVRGFPCTRCDAERRVCSKTFISLCGVDLEMDAATLNCVNPCLLLACLLVISIYTDFFSDFL